MLVIHTLTVAFYKTPRRFVPRARRPYRSATGDRRRSVTEFVRYGRFVLHYYTWRIRSVGHGATRRTGVPRTDSSLVAHAECRHRIRFRLRDEVSGLSGDYRRVASRLDRVVILSRERDVLAVIRVDSAPLLRSIRAGV